LRFEDNGTVGSGLLIGNIAFAVSMNASDCVFGNEKNGSWKISSALLVVETVTSCMVAEITGNVNPIFWI